MTKRAFQDLIDDVDFDRKPNDLDEVEATMPADHLAFEAAPLMELAYQEVCPKGLLGDFSRLLPQYFILLYGTQRFLVDTQGYTYVRYITRITPAQGGQ